MFLLWNASPAVPILVLGAGLTLVLAAHAWLRPLAGGRWFALLMLAVTEWQASRAAEAAAMSVSAKVAWGAIEYVGIGAAPPLWLLFTLAYTARRRPLTRRLVALLWIIPIVTVGLALTNGRHHLLWTHISPSTALPGASLTYVHGPWFWFVAAYTYLLLAGAALLLVRTLIRSPRTYRPRLRVLLAGGALPWLGNLIYLTGHSPLPGVDPTPFAFALSGLAASWGLLQHQLLDLAPRARAVLIESMADGVLVLDAHDHIVDANPAAVRLLGGAASPVIGRRASDVLAAMPTLLALCRAPLPVEGTVRPPDDPRVILEVRGMPVHTPDDEDAGRLLVLRDVTARERAAADVHALNARLVAQLAENAVLHARLREEAIRDPLTGLHNRRYLDEMLTRDVSRAIRAGHPVAVIVLDIDHFKAINDRRGHQAGDDVLRALAALLRADARAEDVICRQGGEEFVAVLPGATRAEARTRAEDWRRAFAGVAVRHEGGEIRATLSAGVAVYPQDGTTGEAVLRAADAALYDAKSAGRDRVAERRETMGTMA